MEPSVSTIDSPPGLQSDGETCPNTGSNIPMPEDSSSEAPSPIEKPANFRGGSLHAGAGVHILERRISRPVVKMSVRSSSPLLVWHPVTIEINFAVCPSGMALHHSLPRVDRLCSTVHEKDGPKRRCAASISHEVGKVGIEKHSETHASYMEPEGIWFLLQSVGPAPVLHPPPPPLPRIDMRAFFRTAAFQL